MTDLTLRRVIDAPVRRVSAAWTDSELLRQWLAPGNAVASRAVADVGVGGTFLIEMRGTDGQRWLARGVYREVAPLRRLVHTWRWEGSDTETLVTIEFEPEHPFSPVSRGNQAVAFATISCPSRNRRTSWRRRRNLQRSAVVVHESTRRQNTGKSILSTRRCSIGEGLE